MAKVTWKGEGAEGPKETVWAGKTFKIGEAVDVDDPRLVGKAKNNPFFEVSGTVSAVEAAPAHVPPSQQSAQGPVPKPGELITPRVRAVPKV